MDDGDRVVRGLIIAICLIVAIIHFFPKIWYTANDWVDESDQRLYQKYYGE